MTMRQDACLDLISTLRCETILSDGDSNAVIGHTQLLYRMDCKLSGPASSERIIAKQGEELDTALSILRQIKKILDKPEYVGELRDAERIWETLISMALA